MTSPNNTQTHFTNSSAMEPTANRTLYGSATELSSEAMRLRNNGSMAGLSENGSVATETKRPSNGESEAPAYAPRGSFPSTAASINSSGFRLKLSATNMSLPIEERGAEVLRIAIEAFPQTDNWVIFYREILGVEGVARKLFETADELGVWESTPQFIEVHTMLAALRSHDTGKGDSVDGQRMITVRLPTSLHEVLKRESDEQSLSINKLCITKLLQKLDPRFAPEEPGKRRGRKPGPQGKRVPKVIA